VPRAIEVTGGDYEHTLGLAGIRDGIDIRYKTALLREVFVKMLNERCYEACEFSLSNYLMLKDRGADWLHAIPVFPYRAFRHSTLYVRKDSPLREPVDLRGKRIGVPDFSMTAAVWTRGILADQYDVQWPDLQWVVSGRQRFPTLPGVTLQTIDGDLEAALIEGRIDALLTPQTADDRKPADERKLRTLIADAQAAEEAYLRMFGIYPINHVVIIRGDALQRLPGLPRVLFEAYAQAKAHAYARQLGTTLMPWGARHWKKTFDQFGGDPLPYGLNEINRKVVAKLAKHLYDQKLIAREPDMQALFLPGIERF
jgi:4,5-dihydroxyphthalate decarboxylase